MINNRVLNLRTQLKTYMIHNLHIVASLFTRYTIIYTVKK